MHFALMQPYFFPYLGYFSLIDSSEEFMFFDQVQFNKKSWMTRNRLLNLSNGSDFYIRPDLDKAEYRADIREVTLKQDGIWQKKLISQLDTYRNKAKHYDEVRSLLENIFSESQGSLADFNISSTMAVSRYLNLDTRFSVYTEKDFVFQQTPDAGTWSLEVSKQVGASHYINAPGGEEFILPEGFSSAGIKLGFIQVKLESYWQGGGDFVPGLSILDVLLFNGPEKTREMIKNYEVKWAN